MIEGISFDSLFRTYYQPLYTFALQYVDADDAHDMVANAFEELWRNKNAIRLETAKSYLYVSVRNRCVDFVRHQKCHQQYVEFVEHTASYCINEVQAADDSSFSERLVKLIFDALKPPTDQILRACYIDEKKYREVAEEMNISVSAVRKHMIRALKIIRDIRKKLQEP